MTSARFRERRFGSHVGASAALVFVVVWKRVEIQVPTKYQNNRANILKFESRNKLPLLLLMWLIFYCLCKETGGKVDSNNVSWESLDQNKRWKRVTPWTAISLPLFSNYGFNKYWPCGGQVFGQVTWVMIRDHETSVARSVSVSHSLFWAFLEYLKFGAGEWDNSCVDVHRCIGSSSLLEYYKSKQYLIQQ